MVGKPGSASGKMLPSAAGAIAGLASIAASGSVGCVGGSTASSSSCKRGTICP